MQPLKASYGEGQSESEGGGVTVPEGQHLCHPRDLAIYDGW